MSCEVISGRQEPTSLRDLFCYPEEGFLNMKVATQHMISRPQSILSLLKMCSDSSCCSVETWTPRKECQLYLHLSDVAVRMWAVLPTFRTNLAHIHCLGITLFRKISLLYGRWGRTGSTCSYLLAHTRNTSPPFFMYMVFLLSCIIVFL